MAEQTITKEYASSLRNVKESLEIVKNRLGKPKAQLDKSVEEFAHSVERWSAESAKLADTATDQGERDFLMAASEVRAGHLVFAAAGAAERGDEETLRKEISSLEAEQKQAESGHLVALFFEPDLLKLSETPSDPNEALKQFKDRSIRTLNNMVTETRDVVADAWDKFAKKFDSFVSALGDLAKSFSSEGAQGWIRWGVEKIVSGLKSLAAFLKSDALDSAIGYLKQLGANLSVESMLAGAFGRDGTVQTIQNLPLKASATADVLNSAAEQLAAIATRFVRMMKQARWVLTAIGAVGGLLTLAGVTAAHAALATPIAYAVVAVAVIIIGMDFADAGPVDLIPGVRSVLRTL